VINKKYLELFKSIGNEKSDIEQHPDSKILIIDGLNTFIRVFSIFPSLNDDGVHVGGIVGFFKSIAYAIRTVMPTRVIIVFDGKGGSQRKRKLFPDYKNKRKPSARFNRVDIYSNSSNEKKSMLLQLQRIIDYLNVLPVLGLSVDNVEADDVIAYISKQIYNKPENKIVIMSTDKDFLQLVDSRISVWSPTKKKLYRPETVMREYGIPSHNFLTYRLLDGDISDSIPGIKGWGLKTIIKNLPMITEDGVADIDTIVSYSEKQKGKLFENLYKNKDKLILNYDLMQLSDVNISGSVKMKVMDMVRSSIQRLVKFKFQRMFMEDKLWTALPDLNSWLVTSFGRLNTFAKRTHESDDK
jgi:DNA polymerase-1|tara:strand:- start:472 stop:1536 length:1065 start_codon:yes stop_codon:yes gene_type:complete